MATSQTSLKMCERWELKAVQMMKTARFMRMEPIKSNMNPRKVARRLLKLAPWATKALLRKIKKLRSSRIKLCSSRERWRCNKSSGT